MRAKPDNLAVRASRRITLRKRPQQRDQQNQFDGDVAVAAVWLVFYVLAIALAISSPVISRAIEFAAR